MTKESLEQLGLKACYTIPNNMFVFERNSTQLLLTTDIDNNLENIEVHSFINSIKTTNIEEINKIYEKTINDILEIKNKHIEVISQKKN